MHVVRSSCHATNRSPRVSRPTKNRICRLAVGPRFILIFRPGRTEFLPRTNSVRFRSSTVPPPDGFPHFRAPLARLTFQRSPDRPPVVYPAPADPAFAFSNASPIHVHFLARPAFTGRTSSRSRIRTKRAYRSPAFPEHLSMPELATARHARGTQLTLSVRASFDADAAPFTAREVSRSRSRASCIFRHTISRSRARHPQDPRFLRPQIFGTLGFWPLSRGGQSRVRGDSFFASGNAARSFDQVAPNVHSTLRSSDHSFACSRCRAHARAHSRNNKGRRPFDSRLCWSTRIPFEDTRTPEPVRLATFRNVCSSSDSQFQGHPFGARATSLAAITPRTLLSQRSRSHAPHDAGARVRCARSSSAYCHRVAWLFTVSG